MECKFSKWGIEIKVEEKKQKRAKKQNSVFHKFLEIKNKKRMTLILGIGIFLFLLGSAIRVDTIHIIGNQLYTAEKIQEDLFSGKTTKSTIVVFWEKLTKSKNTIPYLKEYQISFENYHTITVTVQEKEIFGCIDYGSGYAYIDQEGMVLDFDEEKWDNVSIMEGLYVTKAILHETIETAYLDRLQLLQRLQILLQQHEIVVDSLYCSPQGTFRIQIGHIQVLFGDTSELEEKVNIFASILPTMEGLSGTLYLNEYNAHSNTSGYRFEVTY